MNFGEFINEAIKRKGITKKQLAEEIGATQSSITRYTQGKTVPNDDTISKLEKALELESGSLKRIVDSEKGEKSNIKKRRIYEKNDTETNVLKAWRRGERTPYEVSEITGYSMKVVAKYLPVGGGFG